MIKLRNCSWEEFPQRLIEKKLYCFGCGALSEWLSYEVSHYSFAQKITAFVDNNPLKAGTYISIDETRIPVIGFDDFTRSILPNSIMLITSMYYAEMIRQMDQEEKLNNLECYVEVFLREKTNSISFPRHNTSLEKIPRKLHYCWFGKSEIPEQYRYYISTWQKYCPDYEIVRWDESNYDVSKVTYTKQAYEEGKWAFVSDYARLDIIYTQGGIYLDVDVEMLQNPDILLTNSMFCGFEQGNLINTGLGFGACKGLTVLKNMRDQYKEVSFLNESGKMNLTACTKYQTDFLQKLGLKRNGFMQKVGDITVYPRTVFAPYDFYGLQNHLTRQTISIHHYEASWLKGKNKRALIVGDNKSFLHRMEQSNDK